MVGIHSVQGLSIEYVSDIAFMVMLDTVNKRYR